MTNWAALAEELDDLPEEEEHQPLVVSADVADGGYLSWLYGSSMLRHQAWPPKFIGAKPLIVMDSQETLFRKTRNPMYKVNREERRDQNIEWQKRTQMVVDFRQLIEEEDGRFKFTRISGLEADDLVALATWRYSLPKKPLRVMGIDKDFVQLHPHILLTDKDGQRVDLARFQRRLPRTVQSPVMRHGWQVPLVLSLMGDKSDGIPRLLPPRALGLNFMCDLLRCNSDEAFIKAYDAFGGEFLMNLYDVALPDPSILDLDPLQVLTLFSENKWNAHLYTRVWRHIREEVETWNLSPSKR